MAFNPVAQYNVSDPYGTSPGQRLASSLAGTSFQRRGVESSAARNRLDLDREYRESVPRVDAGFAKRGLITSGLRNRGRADLASRLARLRADQRGGLSSELLGLALQDLAAQAQFSGGRFESALGGASSQAELAAKIREALG